MKTVFGLLTTRRFSFREQSSSWRQLKQSAQSVFYLLIKLMLSRSALEWKRAYELLKPKHSFVFMFWQLKKSMKTVIFVSIVMFRWRQFLCNSHTNSTHSKTSCYCDFHHNNSVYSKKRSFVPRISRRSRKRSQPQISTETVKIVMMFPSHRSFPICTTLLGRPAKRFTNRSGSVLQKESLISLYPPVRVYKSH